MNLFNYKIADSIGGRTEQQDSSGAVMLSFGLLVVVCDGMGGARGGATASKMAVNIILDYFSRRVSNPAAIGQELAKAITIANVEIYNRSRTDENYRGMGTTVTSIIVQKDKATVAHVGDSRVYQLRMPGFFGKNIKKVFRTNDHSRVFELVKRGVMDEEQARVSEDSNIILRALGIKPDVDVEIEDDIPYLKGDRFLLCTDGVCGAVPESMLLKMLNTKATVETTVTDLISGIDQIGHKNGGEHDNLTAALIECNTDSNIAAPHSSRNPTLVIISLSVLLTLSLGYNGYLKWHHKTEAVQIDTPKSNMGSIANNSENLQAIIKPKDSTIRALGDTINARDRTIRALGNPNKGLKKTHNTGGATTTGHTQQNSEVTQHPDNNNNESE